MMVYSLLQAYLGNQTIIGPKLTTFNEFLLYSYFYFVPYICKLMLVQSENHCISKMMISSTFRVLYIAPKIIKNEIVSQKNT